MSTTAYDPWKLVGQSPDETPASGVAGRYKATTVKRARRRVPDVTDMGDHWSVKGNSSLGDERGSYSVVQEPGGKWSCSCYGNMWGDSRQRRTCTHVIAVQLVIEDRESGSVSTGDESEADGIAASLTLIDVDPGDNALDNQDEDPKGSSSVPSVPLGPHPYDCPDIADEKAWGNRPLPDWVTEIRPHQWDAVREIQDALRSPGVVWLDAPTGSGKTLIGELVRRRLNKRAAYICSSLSLQDQFLRDFDYARILKGRSNYPTQLQPFPEYTCNDCTKVPKTDECDWCVDTEECAYRVAKKEAHDGPLAVVNTAYYLYECNYVSQFVGGGMHGRPLVIADECDTLEKSLMGFVEFSLTDRFLRSLGLKEPAKGTHKTTWEAWLQDEVLPRLREEYKSIPPRGVDVVKLRRRAQVERLGKQARSIVDAGIGAAWVRDNEAGPFVLKPVKVDEQGEKLLWQHGGSWLCMSATIISPDEQADSLGLSTTSLPSSLVQVPMTFPKENRPIYVCPVANMTHKLKEEEWPKMALAVERILNEYPAERVLIHTVSYALADYLLSRCSHLSRPLVTYKSASDRENALSRYRSQTSAVMFAPSFDRGVDLKDDDCRVVVVAKIPYPSLMDRQVSERKHMPGGNTWYAVQTVRSLVQMTGRGVRSKDDWCKTFILDKQFTINLFKKNGRLFPSWWTEAIDRTYPWQSKLTNRGQ